MKPPLRLNPAQKSSFTNEARGLSQLGGDHEYIIIAEVVMLRGDLSGIHFLSASERD